MGAGDEIRKIHIMQIVRVAADNNDIDLKAYAKVYGLYLMAGSGANAQADVYDAATVTGTAIVSIAAVQASSEAFLFPGGVQFKTAISVDMTGAGAVLHLLVD